MALEAWENVTAGRVWVKKYGSDGKLRDEIVSSKRLVHLTPEERRLNQEMAATEDLDVFANGVLQPSDDTMKLLSGDESTKEIASNPNYVSDSDLKALVRGHHKTLEARLREIRNPAALQKLHEAARAENASISTVERIQARLAEVSPSLYQEIVSVGGPSGEVIDPREGGLRPVTPR